MKRYLLLLTATLTLLASIMLTIYWFTTPGSQFWAALISGMLLPAAISLIAMFGREDA